MKEATDADAKWAPKLRALKADDDLTVSSGTGPTHSRTWAGVREAGKSYLNSLPSPPKDGSPQDNADGGTGSPEERAA